MNIFYEQNLLRVICLNKFLKNRQKFKVLLVNFLFIYSNEEINYFNYKLLSNTLRILY